jgi:hypothetical protein
MFYNQEIRHRKLAYQVDLSLTFLLFLYINCIIVTRHPDDCHRGIRNMLVKNTNVCD